MNQRLKIFGFLSFTLFACSTLAQKPDTSDIPGRFQLGISFSPDICYRTLKDDGSMPYANTVIGIRNETETVKFGYTAGINAAYRISDLISLEAGVHYSLKGFQTKEIDAIVEQENPENLKKFKDIQDFHYLDIPVRLNFTVGQGKLRFIGSVGLTANLLQQVKTTQVLIYEDRTEEHTVEDLTKYKSFNLSPTVSAGIDYQLNKRMNLRVEPTFRYGLMDIYTEAPLVSNLYSGGIAVGYYYTF